MPAIRVCLRANKRQSNIETRNTNSKIKKIKIETRRTGREKSVHQNQFTSRQKPHQRPLMAWVVFEFIHTYMCISIIDMHTHSHRYLLLTHIFVQEIITLPNRLTSFFVVRIATLHFAWNTNNSNNNSNKEEQTTTKTSSICREIKNSLDLIGKIVINFALPLAIYDCI